MWKKEGAPDPVHAPRPEPVQGFERNVPKRASGERATIGRSITINGEVSGDEDLLIQGRVDGSVNLKQHSVTVGPEGEVKADITARVVTVEGSVKGNLHAEEQVVLRSAALVEGDITAPRVVLEDGARFRGGVDMGATSDRGAQGADSSKRQSTPEPTRAASGGAQTSAQLETNVSAGGEQGSSVGKKESAPSASAKPVR